MKKVSTEEKKKRLSEEYGQEKEKEDGIKEEFTKFFNSTALYISESIKLYSRFLKKLFEKASFILCDELGEKEAGYKKRAKIFLISLGLVLVGILVSRTPFMTCVYPVSLALVSSSGMKNKRHSPFTPRITVMLTFFSAVLSTLFMNGAGLLYFTVIFTLFILRSVVTKGEFDESAVFRTLTSFGSAILLSSFLMIIDSFSLASVSESIALCITVPIFTYVLSGLFISLGDGLESGIQMKKEVGILLVLFLVGVALNDIGIFGFSLSAVFGFVITVIGAKTLGALQGGVFGLVTGVAAGGGLFAAVFGIIGILASIFFSLSDLLSLTVSVLISSIVSVYISSFEGLLATLPEILFGTIVAYPILKLLPVSQDKIRLLSAKISTNSLHLKEGVEKKLEKMSGTFATLSEVFFAVTDSMKTPTLEDVEITVESAMNKVCACCSMSGACWSKHYSDSQNVKKSLSYTLRDIGRLSLNDFPDYFKERCIRSEELIDSINKNYTSYCLDMNDVSRAGIIAGQYHTVSKLLRNTADSFTLSEKENLILANSASSAMKSLSIPYSRIEAYGARNSIIDVFGVDMAKIERSSEAILGAFESETCYLFEEPEFINLDNSAVMRLKRKAPITLECAHKSCTKKGENINGDTVTFFEKDDGYFYALISDGMGSGRQAALTSRLASIFLEKLLTCTDDKKTTLEMLNTLLMTKKDECFTTLDLVEFDLFEMKALFLKAGAAPSFILREDKVYKVNSKTLPAGIVSKLSAEETKITVKDGDTIVLLSDGIIDTADIGAEDNPWLVELLDKERLLSAEELSSLILSEALSRFQRSDDMSVAVIKVRKEA